jgi:hypothetical protein
MSQLGDDYRAMRDYRRQSNERRRKRNVDWIERFRQEHPEHDVEELTPYQFRIDDTLDIYPTSQLFHNIETGARGSYKTIPEIVKQQIGEGA